ncbi:MAG TPA: twin-arginine translocase TatA/TatE family subunit [Acetobacteraceae bacterium]|jgi:sec-independent protein translocase protein TatA|nr:twin-arginine translocase TatA/TatE family subunit [Acetobacteraceae bacterium]
MGEFSIWHWMVVLLVVLLLFGGGKVSGLMGDLAKGIKAFKQNMADDHPAPSKDTAQNTAQSIPGPGGETVLRPTAAGETATVAPEHAESQRETTAAH